jgi:hypothetical protein
MGECRGEGGENLSTHEPEEYLEKSRDTHWCVMFEHVQDVPPADAMTWKDGALPLADPEAFPLPMGVTKSGRIQRPSSADLTLMEGLLRVFALLKRADVRAGRLAREVATFDGAREIALEAELRM